MSLYNVLFGHNDNAEFLLRVLNIHANQITRFRDIFWDGEHIVIHTRTGGGNREEYAVDNERLTRVPGYVRDEDAEFDPTYANFYYKPPAEMEAIVKQLKPDMPPAEKWDMVLKALDQQRTVSKEQS